MLSLPRVARSEHKTMTGPVPPLEAQGAAATMGGMGGKNMTMTMMPMFFTNSYKTTLWFKNWESQT